MRCIVDLVSETHITEGNDRHCHLKSSSHPCLQQYCSRIISKPVADNTTLTFYRCIVIRGFLGAPTAVVWGTRLENQIAAIGKPDKATKSQQLDREHGVPCSIRQDTLAMDARHSLVELTIKQNKKNSHAGPLVQINHFDCYQRRPRIIISH